MFERATLQGQPVLFPRVNTIKTVQVGLQLSKQLHLCFNLSLSLYPPPPLSFLFCNRNCAGALPLYARHTLYVDKCI